MGDTLNVVVSHNSVVPAATIAAPDPALRSGRGYLRPELLFKCAALIWARLHEPNNTMSLIALFIRGWSMVSMVSLNTVQIAHGRTWRAVIVGFGISFLWWTNSSKHRSDARCAGLVYASGAALGTLTGIWIGWHWG